MKSEEELKSMQAEKVALQRGNIALRVVISTIEEQNAMYQAILTTMNAHIDELKEQANQLEKQASEDNDANEEALMDDGSTRKAQKLKRISSRSSRHSSRQG